MVIRLRNNSAYFWRKCLKQSYPDIIIGSQRRNSVIQEAEDSRAVKHVVYWKLPGTAAAEEGAKTSPEFKVMMMTMMMMIMIMMMMSSVQVSITVYGNHVMQVKGSTFLVSAAMCRLLVLRYHNNCSCGHSSASPPSPGWWTPPCQ